RSSSRYRRSGKPIWVFDMALERDDPGAEPGSFLLENCETPNAAARSPRSRRTRYRPWLWVQMNQSSTQPLAKHERRPANCGAEKLTEPLWTRNATSRPPTHERSIDTAKSNTSSAIKTGFIIDNMKPLIESLPANSPSFTATMTKVACPPMNRFSNRARIPTLNEGRRDEELESENIYCSRAWIRSGSGCRRGGPWPRRAPGAGGGGAGRTEARASGHANSPLPGDCHAHRATGRATHRGIGQDSRVRRGPARQRGQYRVRAHHRDRRLGNAHDGLPGVLLPAYSGDRSAVSVQGLCLGGAAARRPHRAGAAQGHGDQGHLWADLGPLRLARDRDQQPRSESAAGSERAQGPHPARRGVRRHVQGGWRCAYRDRSRGALHRAVAGHGQRIRAALYGGRFDKAGGSDQVCRPHESRLQRRGVYGE